MSPSDPTILDLPAEAASEVAALVRVMQRANGPFMRVLNKLGGQVEDRMELLPVPIRDSMTTLTAGILEQVYRAAATVGGHRAMPRADARLHRLAAVASGAAGGAAGLGSALVELPATVALIFGAMQKVAGETGFDPASDEVRLICLEAFGSGGPGRADDGVDTAFLGARLGLSGAAIHAVIARVAPRFATLLGQKLASQTVPILGAAAGAGVNYLFMDYFQAMARVRFGLRRLALDHGEDPVRAAFRAEIARSVSPPDTRS